MHKMMLALLLPLSGCSTFSTPAKSEIEKINDVLLKTCATWQGAPNTKLLGTLGRPYDILPDGSDGHIYVYQQGPFSLYPVIGGPAMPFASKVIYWINAQGYVYGCNGHMEPAGFPMATE